MDKYKYDNKNLAKLRAANVLLKIMNNHKDEIAELVRAKAEKAKQTKAA